MDHHPHIGERAESVAEGCTSPHDSIVILIFSFHKCSPTISLPLQEDLLQNEHNSAQGCYTKEKKSWGKLLQPLMSAATLLSHLTQLEQKLEISRKATSKNNPPFYFFQLNPSVLKISTLTCFVCFSFLLYFSHFWRERWKMCFHLSQIHFTCSFCLET